MLKPEVYSRSLRDIRERRSEYHYEIACLKNKISLFEGYLASLDVAEEEIQERLEKALEAEKDASSENA